MNPVGTTWNEVTNEIRAAPTMPNREFLEMFARPGRVGLACEVSIPVGASRRAATLPSGAPGNVWTHAFVFEGRRLDAQHWVMETDFRKDRPGVSLGLQESRLVKYFDEGLYHSLAVLDLRITDDQMALLLREGLEWVAGRARFSPRTLWGDAALSRRVEARGLGRYPGRERSVLCSAFFRYLFAKAGMDLAPALRAHFDVLADITRISLPHMTYLLTRSAPAPKAAPVRPGPGSSPRQTDSGRTSEKRASIMRGQRRLTRPAARLPRAVGRPRGG